MVLIPLFWTKAGIRGATATVTLAAVKAVAMVLLWTGAAIWRATFVRSARVKARCAILAFGYKKKAFLEGEETGGFFTSQKGWGSTALLLLVGGSQDAWLGSGFRSRMWGS